MMTIGRSNLGVRADGVVRAGPGVGVPICPRSGMCVEMLAFADFCCGVCSAATREPVTSVARLTPFGRLMAG